MRMGARSSEGTEGCNVLRDRKCPCVNACGVDHTVFPHTPRHPFLPVKRSCGEKGTVKWLSDDVRFEWYYCRGCHSRARLHASKEWHYEGWFQAMKVMF